MKHHGFTSKLSDDQKDDCAKSYRAGATLLDLALRHGVSTSTIQNALKMRGVVMRGQGRRKRREVVT